MFKNSPSICYTFFAIDDVIVMSVNTYISMMGISTEDSTYQIFTRNGENKKYGGKQLLKLFPNKNWMKSWLTESVGQKINNTGTVRTMRGRPLPNTSNKSTYVVNFLNQRFQSTKTPVFVRKQFKQSLCSIFLIFCQRFDQVLIFSANRHHWRIGINWRHNFVISSKECTTNRSIIFKYL